MGRVVPIHLGPQGQDLQGTFFGTKREEGEADLQFNLGPYGVERGIPRRLTRIGRGYTDWLIEGDLLRRGKFAAKISTARTDRGQFEYLEDGEETSLGK